MKASSITTNALQGDMGQSVQEFGIRRQIVKQQLIPKPHVQETEGLGYCKVVVHSK